MDSNLGCLRRQTLAVAWVAARANLAYPLEVLGRAGFLAVILYIFLRLWQTTYEQSGSDKLAGLSLPDMIWYLSITEAMWMSAPRLSQQIDQDVRSGNLSVLLLRPMAYPLYCLMSNLGERSTRFLFNLLISFSLALLLVGPVKLSAEGAIMTGTAILAAFILDGLAHILIGLTAIYFQDTSGLTLIYTRLTMILGGMLIPIELFPDWLRSLVKFLPFPYMMYEPVKLFARPDWQEYLKVLGGQSLSAIVLTTLVAIVYRHALSKISTNGG